MSFLTFSAFYRVQKLENRTSIKDFRANFVGVIFSLSDSRQTSRYDTNKNPCSRVD